MGKLSRMVVRFLCHLVVGAALVGAGVSCASKRAESSSSATQPSETIEILRHPEILIDGSVAPSDMTLNGVRLGQPESEIPEQLILERKEAGWILAREDCRYRVLDGRVVTLGVWNDRALEKLQIRTRDDLAARFGPPSSVDDLNEIQIYRYDERKLTAIWNEAEGELNAVNVSESGH